MIPRIARKRQWSEADKALVRRIARFIAAIHDSAVSTDALLIDVDGAFPDASFRAFVAGYFLFQIERSEAPVQ
jgi:hypothetical protein